MKRLIFVAILGVIISCVGSSQAAVHVYEPFDYTAGSDINTPLDGGAGFAVGSAWAPGQQGGVVTVYDETAATVTNDNAGGELTWDGVVDNVPTSPAVGSRFIASGPSGTIDRITAQRELSQSAGALAGDDKILWASVVWHQQGSNYGRHVGFALGTDDLANRSVNIDSSGNGIGVGGAYNTGLVTPTIWINGNWDTDGVRTTTGATNVSYSEDNIVVLKFEFGATDTVTAYTFTESATLDEAIFNANAISASAAIDENTLNILSFSQSRGQEAIDEIRLGDSFADVVGAVDPMVATVDAGSDWVTWSGEPVQLVDVNVVNNDPPAGALTLQWTSTAPAGVIVGFSDDTIEEPEITVTKPLDGDVAVVECKLTVTQPEKYPVVSVMEIDVYDDSCRAAVGSGNHVITPGDVNANCVTDFEDLLEMGQTWLVDFALTEAVDK